MAKPFQAFLLKGYTKCTIVLKNLLFEIFLTIHGKTMAKPFLSLLLQGYTRAIILPIHQAQGPSMWLSPGPGPNSNLSPSTPKQWKPKCSYQELNLNPCWRQTATDEIQKIKKYRECSKITARVSVHLPMPVSPSGVSGISAFPFRTCRSLDEL